MKIPGQQNNSDSSKLFEELFQGLVTVLRQRERCERGDGETVKGSDEKHSFERQNLRFAVYLLIRFEAKRAVNVILPASQ